MNEGIAAAGAGPEPLSATAPDFASWINMKMSPPKLVAWGKAVASTADAAMPASMNEPPRCMMRTASRVASLWPETAMPRLANIGAFDM